MHPSQGVHIVLGPFVRWTNCFFIMPLHTPRKMTHRIFLPSFVLVTLIVAAILQWNVVLALVPGPYSIEKANEQLLTAQFGAPVTILSPTGQPREQEWIIDVLPNRNVAIRSLKWPNKFLGIKGNPEVGIRVALTEAKYEWQLRKSAELSRYFIVVPGSPLDGEELTVDLAPLQIYPPLIELRRLRPQDPSQTWRFTVLE